MTPNRERLEVCPFCGVEPDIVPDNEWELSRVYCDSAECSVYPAIAKQNLEMAIDAWNCRATSALDKAREEVVEAAKKVQIGATVAFKPHGAVICHMVHDPLAEALNEQHRALDLLAALRSKSAANGEGGR